MKKKLTESAVLDINKPLISDIGGAYFTLIPTSNRNKPQYATTIMLTEKCLFPLYPGSKEGRILVSS